MVDATDSFVHELETRILGVRVHAINRALTVAWPSGSAMVAEFRDRVRRGRLLALLTPVSAHGPYWPRTFTARTR